MKHPTLAPEEIEKIRQKKMDALAAKHLHQRRLDVFKKRSTLTDCLAFVVPVLYFSIRYILKGSSYQAVVEHVWEVLAAVLTGLALVKILYKWQESTEKHGRLMNSNIEAISQAEALLRRSDSLDNRDLEHFYGLMDKLEAEDREAILTIKKEHQQEAYREALKEFEPGSASCPRCKASPWDFKPGSCQLCGNTPATNKTTEGVSA